MRTWNMRYLVIDAHFSICELRVFDLAQTQSHIFQRLFNGFSHDGSPEARGQHLQSPR
jgi:hypothetical protein